jgi:tetratricopeptide (TPR) repeat protein
MKIRLATAWSAVPPWVLNGLCIVTAGSLMAVQSPETIGTRLHAADALAKQASWQALDSQQIIAQFRGVLEESSISADQADIALETLQRNLEDGDGDPLNALTAAASEVMPAVARLQELTQESPTLAATWFASAEPLAATFDQLPALIEASARTWLARELVQQRLYDEALPVFADVEASDSVDPASVLFYRGVCRHSLLMKKEALEDLRRLLENESDAPVRFVRTAHLMVADIKPLKEDSLDEISRLMTDVTRRLDLGRADSDVQQREQTIIDKLSKLIEDMEEQQRQQQQQQQQAQASGDQSKGGSQGRPMDDSQIAGSSGQGDVDRKNLGDRSGWGNLPPAQREEALQQISRDLPTHYREAIEAYFRKLATGG